jgi:hypothetical protein
MKKTIILVLTLAVCPLAFAADSGSGLQEKLGDRFGTQPTVVQPSIAPSVGLDTLHRWNQIAVNASGLDHTPVPAGDPRHFGEQLGPCRSARAIALVHIGMFDVMNAIERSPYKGYTNLRTTLPASEDAAIAQVAHDMLVSLYPSQTASFDSLLAQDLARIRNGISKTSAIRLARKEARNIVTLRANDGVQVPEPHVNVDYVTSNAAGHWRQDPISLIPLALGAHWGECIPLVLLSGSQFRTPAPPDMTSAAYAAAYNEVKALGGDGVNTPTQRTAEETFVAIYWGYDGTPSLCAPPRLYNQIAVHIADQQGVTGIKLARLLALVNTAMSDAAVTAWESKYHWDFWRPITGIRESDPGTGPTGAGDGNPDTVGDTSFHPLGAPASNLMGPNFTPPFPAYPSGHATIGGALFQTLRRFFGTDNIPFTFTSDEFNGQTRANDGTIRPLKPRSFTTLSQAEEENGQSRIYLGIHWSFDKTEGIASGRTVGDFVFDHAFTKNRRP